LDADDFFEPDRLEVLIDEAESRQCDFIADNLRLHDADGVCEGLAFDPQGMSRKEPLRLIDLVTMDASPGSGARALGFCKPIFRRQFICDHGLTYDLRAFVGQDFIFYFNAISRGARFCLTPVSLYNFTVGRASHSTGERALMEITEANARLIKEEPRIDPAVRAALRRREAQLRYDIFRTHVRNKAPLEALSALARVQPKFVFERLIAALGRKARRAFVIVFPSPKDAKI
jgi:hypothetical protein